jgi:hypothetical protein
VDLARVREIAARARSLRLESRGAPPDTAPPRRVTLRDFVAARRLLKSQDQSSA